jgi:hypothetical protein
MTDFEPESKKASVPAHLRVWKDVYDSLAEEARTRRVSLNTIVNLVLSTHTRDDLQLEEGGLVKITKSTLRAALSLIPDDKLREFGRLTAESGADARMLARSNTISPDTILEELRLFSRTGLYSMSETSKGGARIISLTHDFGPRESVALGAFVDTIFAMVEFHPRIKTTNTSITFEVKYVKNETAAAEARSLEGEAARVSARGHYVADRQ